MTKNLLLTLLIAVIAAAQPRPPEMRLPEGTTVLRDVEYIAGGHERNKLDLFVPPGERLPLVIWIHGGAWQSGSKANPRPLRDLAGEGYAVASINYRLSSHAVFPAQIEDCKAAVRWLRANSAKQRLDPDRFAVWGASAGGHLVAMLGVSAHVKEWDRGGNAGVSSRVQAVVDYFGPTDFLQMDAHVHPTGKADHDAPGSPESRLVGGAIQDNREKVARANPITWVRKDAAPFFIAHGDADPLVPHHQSVLLEAALRSAGVPVVFHTVKGGGHGTGFDKDPELLPAVKAFLAKYLKSAR